MSQYNKLFHCQYARFQILAVHLHFGLFWSRGISTVLQVTFPTTFPKSSYNLLYISWVDDINNIIQYSYWKQQSTLKYTYKGMSKFNVFKKSYFCHPFILPNGKVQGFKKIFFSSLQRPFTESFVYMHI